MGTTWSVLAWIENGNSGLGWIWTEVYQGESALSAVLAAVKAKRAGAGCVKVEWR